MEIETNPTELPPDDVPSLEARAGTPAPSRLPVVLLAVFALLLGAVALAGPVSAVGDALFHNPSEDCGGP